MEGVIPSPFGFPLRTALSRAKGLRVNAAGNLLLRIREIRDSSSPAAPRNDEIGQFFNKLLKLIDALPGVAPEQKQVIDGR
jgi:hypothetical protein